MSDGAATVRAWADDLRRFAQQWPAQGARAVAEQVEAQTRTDTGGDGRLSNLKGGGVGVAVEATSGEATVHADGDAGTWAILEFGTAGHVIVPARRRALSTPRGPRPFATVSGVRARRTWTKGLAQGLTECERSADAGWSEAVG